MYLESNSLQVPTNRQGLNEFMAVALGNMERYGTVPYELGRLVAGHVVDAQTSRMAYEVGPDFLDKGSSAAGFLVYERDNPRADVLTVSFRSAVAADLPLSRERNRAETVKRIEALRRARGILGHVQIKAADVEHGLVITTKAPGKEIFHHDDPIEPTSPHWRALYVAARAMRCQFIGFDAKGGNIHWDPSEGFTVYDTHPVGLDPSTWVRPRRLVQGVRNTVLAQNSRYGPGSEWI